MKSIVSLVVNCKRKECVVASGKCGSDTPVRVGIGCIGEGSVSNTYFNTTLRNCSECTVGEVVPVVGVVIPNCNLNSIKTGTAGVCGTAAVGSSAGYVTACCRHSYKSLRCD